MDVQAIVGPQIKTNGNSVQIRADRTAGLVTADVQGRYTEAVVNNKNMFLAANQATKAITGLSSTATGWILSNPNSSTKNMALIDFIGIQTASTGGLYVQGLCWSTSTTDTVHTTPLTVRNCFLGGSVGSGLVDDTATLGATPVAIRSGSALLATTPTLFAPYWKDQTDGILVIAPGGTISPFFLTTATTMLSSGSWCEMPV